MENELTQGQPIIVHIPDRNRLFNPQSMTQRSHVIVVVGIEQDKITFTDSWDGGTHTVTAERFADAWGTGSYNWLAFVFEKQQRVYQTPTPTPTPVVHPQLTTHLIHRNRY